MNRPETIEKFRELVFDAFTTDAGGLDYKLRELWDAIPVGVKCSHCEFAICTENGACDARREEGKE